jgi:hypothetical protein
MAASVVLAILVRRNVPGSAREFSPAQAAAIS